MKLTNRELDLQYNVYLDSLEGIKRVMSLSEFKDKWSYLTIKYQYKIEEIENCIKFLQKKKEKGTNLFYPIKKIIFDRAILILRYIKLLVKIKLFFEKLLYEKLNTEKIFKIALKIEKFLKLDKKTIERILRVVATNNIYFALREE